MSKITEGIRIRRVRSAQAEISRGEAVRRERCRKNISLRNPHKLFDKRIGGENWDELSSEEKEGKQDVDKQ